MRTVVLDIVRELGRGLEGTALLVQDRSTREYYVCKDLREFIVLGTQPLEVQIRKYCMPWNHRSLLNFYGWYFIGNDARRGCQIYYEYCAGGDLGNLIPRRRHPAEHPESLIWHVFIQLAEALHAMHNLGPQHVVHRDVKPENVFLTSPYRPYHNYPTLKLGDYGLATTRPVSRGAGTFYWKGPEVECSAKGDVWGLGAVIHALCHGSSPVSTARRGWERDPRARRPRNLPSRYSNTLNHRMMSCLRRDPRDRPDSETLVRRLRRERPRVR